MTVNVINCATIRMFTVSESEAEAAGATQQEQK
jgi:hypothetical protein